MAAPLSLLLEFGGGAELLFDGVRKHQVNLPHRIEPWNLRHLLTWIKENLLKERPELFVQGDSVATWTINCKTGIAWFSSPPYTVARPPGCVYVYISQNSHRKTKQPLRRQRSLFFSGWSQLLQIFGASGLACLLQG
ncbi:ubiquitin-related modifier 1 isoform 1-T2 [Vipera latastei]